MTTKRRYEWINHRGETVVTDEDVCPPGFGIRAPVLLMDHGSGQPTRTRIVDAFGHAAGSRPGYCFDDGPSAETVKAHDALTQRVSDAWRGPSAAPPASLTKDEAFSLMGQRLQDAWRVSNTGYIDFKKGKHVENGEVNPNSTFLHWEPDSTTDARDAAYDAHVEQVSNAWRGAR